MASCLLAKGGSEEAMAFDWRITRFLRSGRSSLSGSGGEESGDRSRLRGEEGCGECSQLPKGFKD